ncbi:hypothetical protein V6N12_013091 [Hibiscus sabdariffa]|uniref:Uncharacterized protein n=1 Tax=Hibiscus sabdariffa TaxID=183260 RepID=A0ABR2EK28_9ROSI
MTYWDAFQSTSHVVICRELSNLGGTQRQQNLKERSCTEAAPNEETQNGAEKTSAEKRTSAEILGRGRKGNSIRPAIGSIIPWTSQHQDHIENGPERPKEPDSKPRH